MAGRSYTVYFLGKNSEIITLWYELNFDKDTLSVLLNSVSA
jgi:hypothetical protein